MHPELLGSWLLSRLRRGDELAAIIPGTAPTASFDESGRVSGSAGCNRFTAAYGVVGEQLEVSAAASTRMFCSDPAGVMDQEDAFLSALSAAERFRLEGGTLELLDAEGVALLVFERSPPTEG